MYLVRGRVRIRIRVRVRNKISLVIVFFCKLNIFIHYGHFTFECSHGCIQISRGKFITIVVEPTTKVSD